MFDELRLQPFDGRSTAENTVLLKYTHPHPFVTKLLAFREANTLLTRYLAGLPKYIGADGRIHTTFNLHGTVTGRLSSSDPNMQNTPRDNKTVKRLFIPDPGNAWIDVDYSQIELRVIALLSKDPWLMQCYAEGRDLHSEMAEYQYGKAYTKEQRNLAKRANFLLAYGGSVGKLATSLTISPREAASMHERFFERMSGILPWIEEIKALVSKNHVIETPLGRVRHFPEIAYARSQMDRETIYREAVNNNPQSVASDVTLNALIKLHQAGYDVRLTVHDSISVQAPVADARGVAREVMRIMEGSAAELLGDALPFTAEAEIGDSWGTLQEV
jgi:DNA polymerase-1